MTFRTALAYFPPARQASGDVHAVSNGSFEGNVIFSCLRADRKCNKAVTGGRAVPRALRGDTLSQVIFCSFTTAISLCLSAGEVTPC